MSVSVEILGEGGSITIELIGYENPNAVDSYDRNWLSCRVLIQVGNFTGRFAPSLTTQDFQQFSEELSEALAKLSGRASLVTYEDALRVHVDFLSTGTANVSGVGQVFGEPQATLSFVFASDSSYLTRTRDSLRAVVATFPTLEEAS